MEIGHPARQGTAQEEVTARLPKLKPLPCSFSPTLRICARLHLCLPELRLPAESCSRAEQHPLAIPPS